MLGEHQRPGEHAGQVEKKIDHGVVQQQSEKAWAGAQVVPAVSEVAKDSDLAPFDGSLGLGLRDAHDQQGEQGGKISDEVD